MRTVSIRLADLAKTTINIGFVGENEHTRVCIDCKKAFEEYPAAVPALTVQPPAGGAYPEVTTLDGDTVIWDVADHDLTDEGMGEFQLSFVVGETVMKSYIGRLMVCRSIVDAGDVPAAIDDWLTRANAALNEIPSDIAAALQAAKDSGEFDGRGISGAVLNNDYTLTLTFTDGTSYTTPAIRGEKGDKGKDFYIAKTFSSITEMAAYSGTDIHIGDYVMIDTGSTQDADTGKMFCYKAGENILNPSTMKAAVNASNAYIFSATVTITGIDPYIDVYHKTSQGFAGDDIIQYMQRPGTVINEYETIETGEYDTELEFEPHDVTVQNAKVIAKWTYIGDLSGPQGQQGIPGVSPTASVSKSGDTSTLTVTDGSGTTTVQILDGEKGDTGAVPAISVGTVTTGDAGTNAAVTRTGTDLAPVLNFTLPKGAKGDAGNGDMIAPAFAEGTANAAGTYVTYNGGLYLLPNGHTANTTWANTTKTSVTVGGQFSDVKSAIGAMSGNNWFNKDQSYSIVKTNGTTTTGYTINNDGSITCVVNTGNGQVFLKDPVLKIEPDIYNVKCKVTFNASVPNGHREILVRVGTADSAAYVTPKTGYDSSTSMSESDKVGYINYDFTVTSGGNFQFAVMGRYSDVVSSTYPLTIEDLIITQKIAKLEDLFAKSIAFRGAIPNGTNGNDITETGFYIVTNSLTNIPYSSGVLIVYTGNNLGYQTYQLFFAYDGRYPYYRNKMGTSWNDWVQLNADWHKTTTTELNVDNITTSGFYFMTSSNTNKPVNDNGVLLVFNNPDNSSFATYQMFISYTGQNICVRGKYGGAWSNWLGVSQSFGTTNIAWFGDSISALESLPSKTGALISAKTHSFAIPGAPFDTLGTLGTNWKYTYLGFANLMKCLADNDYTDVDTAVAKFIEDNPDWAYSDNMTEFKTLDWSKIDSVVVSYGTNDFNAGVVNLATFKTDIKNAFINLMNEQPHVQIYVFTSPYRVSANTPNSQGLVLTDYVSAIMEVCNELNIPCYDTFHNSGINQHTWETYLVSDQLHLKTAGAKLISQKVAKFLLSN